MLGRVLVIAEYLVNGRAVRAIRRVVTGDVPNMRRAEVFEFTFLRYRPNAHCTPRRKRHTRTAPSLIRNGKTIQIQGCTGWNRARRRRYFPSKHFG